MEDILKNLLELEKMTTTNTVNNETNINSSKSEVIRRSEITEEDELNVNGLDEEGFRNTVTLSEVSNDGSLRKYLVRLKKHGETRWYICSYCSKEFKKPSDLIRHIRVHTKEKPYKVSFITIWNQKVP